MLVSALDGGESASGVAPRGVALQEGGLLTPVYVMSTTVAETNDPVYSSILANESIVIPAQGLDGLDVYWDYLPVGNFTLAIAAEDFYGIVSDPVLYDVSVTAAPAEVLSGPVISGTDFVVFYAGTPGTTYTIEATDSLAAGDWQKVTNLVAPLDDQGNGVGVFEFDDLIGVARERYYRTVWPAY